MYVTAGDPTKGILDFPRALQRFSLQRFSPAVGLRSWLEGYWVVSWNLEQGQVHEQTNISHASVNAAIEPEGAFLYGVPARIFVRRISGTGRVFGTKFRPGGFFAFLGRPLSGLTGRAIALSDIFGQAAREWESECARAAGDVERVDLADAFWRSRLDTTGAGQPPSVATMAAERIIADRSILSVAAAAAAAGMEVRKLQRIFQREVGIGPKEVIRRFRLQEAAERLLREPDLSCGDLALEMGYFDQAHFIRDFKAVVGEAPDLYRRRQPRAGREG